MNLRVFWRADWILAGALTLTSVVLLMTGVLPEISPLVMIDGWLMTPYYTGAVFVVLLTWGESVVRGLAVTQRWPTRIVAIAVGIGAGVYWHGILGHPEAELPVTRLYTLGALGAASSMMAMTLMLIASGMVRIRKVARATLDLVIIFGPFLLFIGNAFTGLHLLSALHPTVLDLNVLRMDESLGFHAPYWFWKMGYFGTWLWEVQYFAYQGISAFVLAVAAVIYFSGDRFARNRCLTAYVLTGLLGWGCYAAYPVVGPSFAFPGLFVPGGDDALLVQMLEVQDRLEISPHVFRNGLPSLHTAWALVALIAAWKHGRRLFFLALPMGFLSIITTVTLCFHYTADLIAAVPFAVFTWWGADRLTRWGSDAVEVPRLSLPNKSHAKWTLIFLGLQGVGVLGWFKWSHHAPVSPWLVWPVLLGLMGGLIFAGGKLTHECNARL